MMEEIRVTAQKRAADIQDVPIAINAHTGDQLDNAGVTNLGKLDMITPGLTVSQRGANSTIFIRGIGSVVAQSSVDPAVALYSDGNYLARAREVNVDLIDVNRVEVLKGPQGTLYGRNATGGAINIVHNNPGYEPELDMLLAAGSDKYRKIALVGNLPLIDQKLALRAAVQGVSRDGYTENLLARETDVLDDFDDLDARSFRMSLLWDPSSDVEVLFSADYFKDTRNGYSMIADTSQTNGAVFFGGRTHPDVRRFYAEFTPGYDNKVWGVYSAVSWDTSDEWSLKWIVGYRDDEGGEVFDIDGTDYRWSFITSPDTDKSVTSEFVANYTGTNFDFTAGAYFYDEELEQNVTILPAGFAPVLTPSVEYEARSFALFAQGSWSFNDVWSLTAGTRVSRDEKEFMTVVRANGIETDDFAGDDDWTPTTWKLGLEARPDDATLIWLSASRGFKSGAFNTAIDRPSVDEETIDAYELGAKWQNQDGSLRLNGSLFFYDYKDIQLETSEPMIPIQITQNASSADVRGLDLDATWQPLSWLQLQASLSLLDTELGDYITDNPATPDPAPENGKGNRLTNAPEVTWIFGTQIFWPMGTVGDGYWRLDWRYRSEVYFEPFNNEYARQGGYSVLDTLLGWESPDGTYGLELFVSNLTDKEYRDNYIITGGGVINIDRYAAPRMWGVNFKWTY